jgi:peptide/nickel transport system permease protein
MSPARPTAKALWFAARRVGQAGLVLWAASTVTFVVLQVLPSDAIEVKYNTGGANAANLTEAQLDQLRAEFGLDLPLWRQYLRFLNQVVHLDLGNSITRNRPVLDLLAENLPPTLQLAAFAVVAAALLGAAIAFLAHWLKTPVLRRFFLRLPAVGVAFPAFWVGLLLIQLFSFRFHLFPATGATGFQSVVLPGLMMALGPAAMLAQLLNRSLTETLAEQYIVTASAKGLSRGAVFWRHALRNAVLPSLTVLGLLIAGTVTGAVVAETVFSRAGIGRLAAQAVEAQDLPLVQGVVLMAAFAFVAVNLVVDLIYPLLDRRIAVT